MNRHEWIRLDQIGSLYQEMILIYFDVPELFVCKDTHGKRYLSLCLDPEEGQYLIAPISLKYLCELLTRKCKIRECFQYAMNKECFYTFYDKKTKSFAFDYLDSNTISDDILPDEDATYDVPMDGLLLKYYLGIERELEQENRERQDRRYLNIPAATKNEKYRYYSRVHDALHEYNILKNRTYLRTKACRCRGEMNHAY